MRVFRLLWENESTEIVTSLLMQSDWNKFNELITSKGEVVDTKIGHKMADELAEMREGGGY